MLSSTSFVVLERNCLPAMVIISAALRLFRVLSMLSMRLATTVFLVSIVRSTSRALV